MDTAIEWIAKTAIGWMLLAFTVGAGIALSELLSRYAWRISVILATAGGWLYMIVNGAVAVLVYRAAVDWEFYAGMKGKSEFWRVVVVSFLAMAVLRSAFLNVKVGDKEFGAGFSAFVEIFKGYAERVLDQQVANRQLAEVGPLVEGLMYSATRNYLFAMSEGALRSVSKHEIAALNKDMERIDKMEVNDSTKMRLFALRISEVTGLKLFTTLASDARANLSRENELVAQQKAGKLQELAAFKSSI